ncbi:Fur-regulated basic protein FbpA [Peribacillus sp. Hz7]|uniref:Fur-regulated basic protein FbpA n=1 Tax=Peribacillus sp. Hz7 TaxID=3344873 RepID=UPI0035C9F7D7
MGNVLRKAVEDRRKKLIDKLIAFKIYKKGDKHLFELSLTELENEYRSFQSHCHPHNDFGSIKWTCKKS